MAKQQTRPAEGLIRVTYPREGEILELVGKQFDVPKAVGDKRAWIESRYREEQAREAAAEAERVAQAEADARNQAVLAERMQQVQATDEIEALIEERIDERLEVIKDSDLAAAVGAAGALTTAVTGLQDLMDKNAQLSVEVAELQAQVTQLLELVGVERQASVDLVVNNREMQNKAFGEFAGQLNAFREELNDNQTEYLAALKRIDDSWETIQKAERINEEALNMVRNSIAEETTKMWDQHYASVNLLLTAFGLDRSGALQSFNQLEVLGDRDAAILTRREIQHYAAMFLAVSKGREDLDAKGV